MCSYRLFKSTKWVFRDHGVFMSMEEIRAYIRKNKRPCLWMVVNDVTKTVEYIDSDDQ